MERRTKVSPSLRSTGARELKKHSPEPNSIHCGDALSVLKSWPADLIDTVVTSPPYYQQRDYHGKKAQVGLEDSPAAYVQKLKEIFARSSPLLEIYRFPLARDWRQV
jgi:DNA modification methylase